MLSVRKNIPIKSSKNVENLECGICCQLFYNAISVSPCLHTFCAGCISHWYLTNPTCPICRLQCMDLIENREKREMVKDAIIDFPEKSHGEECKKKLDEYEKEYLEKYLIHWTIGKRLILHRTSFLPVEVMSTYPTCLDQINPTYQRRMERLHELRIKANGNTDHNLIPIEQYIGQKQRIAQSDAISSNQHVTRPSPTISSQHTTTFSFARPTQSSSRRNEEARAARGRSVRAARGRSVRASRPVSARPS